MNLKMAALMPPFQSPSSDATFPVASLSLSHNFTIQEKKYVTLVI
jgi:hypothetical protein